jgi:RNA polymerase sigma factor (sigma-70 family)
MERKNFIAEKILESMKSIFAFSRSRVSDATQAEDLSQQIITELLASADTLKDENAFYGWMWAVARNTYSKYIRAGKKENTVSIENKNYISDSKADVENTLILKEDINVLRREMSFLVRQYREAVVKYYIEEKSCSQISEELDLTVETVKNLLFKARRILKEGVNMVREYGEKSYNPDILRLDKWVLDALPAYSGFTEAYEKKRLPGNILLSTYYSPMTVEELSVELGVSAPYIEDELNIMLEYKIIKLLPKARYQANIFIYTDSCDKEITAKTTSLYKQYSNKLKELTDKMIPAFKETMFKNSDAMQNNLRWFAAHFILWHASMKKQDHDSPMPLLPLGGRGYIWGLNFEYKQSGFKGIYGKCESDFYSGWVHASNYRLLEKCQPRTSTGKDTDLLLAAVHKSFERYTPDQLAQYIERGFIAKDGDSYKSLCPVVTEAQYQQLLGLCSGAINEMASLLAEIVPTAASVMENHAPIAVKEQCRSLAAITFSGIAEIMENLCESGYLIIPTTHNFLTIYTVI